MRMRTFSRRAVHRTAHGKHSPTPATPSSRPRDAGARTREDIRLPQRSEDRRRGGLAREYNEFAELSHQTVDFMQPDGITVKETFTTLSMTTTGANGDRDALGRITKKTEWIVDGDVPNGLPPVTS